MYLLQAPLSRFVLGAVDHHVRAVPKQTPPTCEELIAKGAASLARAFVMRNGKDVAQLPITGGTITVDSQNEPRRILQAQVAGLDEWIPKDARHNLHPFSRTELRVEIGVANPRGEDFWIPVGVFSVTSSDAEDAADGVSVSVHCPDRIPRIRRTIMRSGVEVGDSVTALEQVMAEVLASSCGDWITLRAWPTGYRVSPGIYGYPGADPWKVLTDLATSFGLKMVLNGRGEAQLTRVFDITREAPQAVWQVGNESSLASIKRSVDVTEYATGIIVGWTENVYNYETYEDEDGAVKTLAYLTGTKPRYTFVPDMNQREYITLDNDISTITSEAQARMAGQAKLVELGKGAEKIAGTAIANPLLEPDAVVQIDDARMNLEMITRITKLTFTLKSNVMSFELGDRAITLGGAA